MKNYRILYLGEDWYGSCARACGFALRRLGHEVIDVSRDNYLPKGRKFLTKALISAVRPLLRREFNEAVLAVARRLSPDMLIAFKGSLISVDTLRQLRAMGMPLYQYYPDNSVFAQPMVSAETMEEYDCCFFTKKFALQDTSQRLSLRAASYLPHGYDPETHHPPEISEEDRNLYASDVAVVGTYTRGKEQFLDELIGKRPDLPLRIWGPGWKQRASSRYVQSKAEGVSLFGQGYAKALHLAKINLALLIEETKGASMGDLTTTRSFEIPACGGFLLHKRTEDILEVYAEGKEMECFDAAEEALEKIEFYLGNENRRREIARNGYSRAVPAYSYDTRMAEIISYHSARHAVPQAAGVR